MLRRARNVRRHRAALARLPKAEFTGDGDLADEVAGRLDDTRRLSDVRQAFSRLRERDREVLLLCVWGGLDYAAAAVVLGIPIGTVRSRLSRARLRLAELADAAPQRGPLGRPGASRTGETS
jgi:RNA polymerase sigma-70 factor (ECF subfamily)